MNITEQVIETTLDFLKAHGIDTGDLGKMKFNFSWYAVSSAKVIPSSQIPDYGQIIMAGKNPSPAHNLVEITKRLNQDLAHILATDRADAAGATMGMLFYWYNRTPAYSVGIMKLSNPTIYDPFNTSSYTQDKDGKYHLLDTTLSSVPTDRKMAFIMWMVKLSPLLLEPIHDTVYSSWLTHVLGMVNFENWSIVGSSIFQLTNEHLAIAAQVGFAFDSNPSRMIAGQIALLSQMCGVAQLNHLITEKWALHYLSILTELGERLYSMDHKVSDNYLTGQQTLLIWLSTNGTVLPINLGVSIVSLARQLKRWETLIYSAIPTQAITNMVSLNPKVKSSKSFDSMVRGHREDAYLILGYKTDEMLADPSYENRMQFARTGPIRGAEALVNDPVAAVRMHLASRPGLPIQTQRILFEDRDHLVRECLASNPIIDLSIKIKLATDPDSAVRGCLAESLKPGMEGIKTLLRILSRDPDPSVIEKLLNKEEDAAGILTEEVGLEILDRPYLDAYKLYKMASVCTITLQVFKRLGTLAKAAKASTFTIASNVINNPSTDPEVLGYLYRNTNNKQLKTALLASSKLPEEIKVLESITN